MYFKTLTGATAFAVVLFAAGCSVPLPWRNEPVGEEVNLAFRIENNLLFLPTLRLDNRAGRFFLATAAPNTVIDPAFGLAQSGPHLAAISEKQSLPLTPSFLDLRGTGDAMLGADVWGRHAITIDYFSGLVTYQRAGIHRDGLTMFRFRDQPELSVRVDGRDVLAVIDTTSPDTLVLPHSTAGRGTAHIVIANQDLGTTDVQYANVARARIGNRLLSKFLVTIDYGARVVGVWRDPRIRAAAPAAGS
ncbi:MAG TPA: hypothetical protein VFN10_07730 [Thermoanaerobaculia bacterium]|nr:hypothetical protein [Thermoanaerobaculia bacterium]